MAIVRWTPWQELESMQKSIGRLLDDAGSPASLDRNSWMPAVDIRETEEALLVHAELPGIDKKDIKVDVRDGVLTISGERRYEKEVQEENVHRIERSYGSFSRSFSLPRNVDSEKVEASIKDGVLEVRLPKQESAKPKTIEIK